MTQHVSQDRRRFLKTSGVAAAVVAAPRLAHAAVSSVTEISAVRAVTAIRSGELRAEDYARALLERCDQLQDLNAFISLDRDAVLEAARVADQSRVRGAPLGALFGLPIPLTVRIVSAPLRCQPLRARDPCAASVLR